MTVSGEGEHSQGLSWVGRSDEAGHAPAHSQNTNIEHTSHKTRAQTQKNRQTSHHDQNMQISISWRRISPVHGRVRVIPVFTTLPTNHESLRPPSTLYPVLLQV